MAVLLTVTAVLLHTVLWIHGLTVILLVQGRGEMGVLPAVTRVLLRHSATDTWNACNDISTG